MSLTPKCRDRVTGATAEVASLKKALSEAEDKAASECKEREKQSARVGEVQQELQDLGKKCESVEHDLKAKEVELAKGLMSLKETPPPHVCFALRTSYPLLSSWPPGSPAMLSWLRP